MHAKTSRFSNQSGVTPPKHKVVALSAPFCEQARTNIASIKQSAVEDSVVIVKVTLR